MADRIQVQIDAGVAHVLLNRPEKKNALDGEMFEGLRAAARELSEDRSVRAVVLSGAGDSFCSGIDLSNFSGMASGGLNTSGLVPLAEGLANEMAASSRLMGSKNQIEAAMSKLEKRAANFADSEDLMV